MHTCHKAARIAARTLVAGTLRPAVPAHYCCASLFSTAPPAAVAVAQPPPVEFGVYPGGKKIRYTETIEDHAPNVAEPMAAHRLMDEDGSIRAGVEDPGTDMGLCLRMYATMVRLQTLDSVFFDAQRQGRISFYMTSGGEEGTHIGSALAMRDDDEVFAQYRESGVLMWRGFSVQNFADQCFSNKDDLGKGRMMPVHYGSAKLHFQTISSPLSTQIPQAAGAAYACKLEGKGRIVCCFFGEGAASEGDFHAGLNMAATLAVPAVFFCRNNGYAISTPVAEQYAGDGIAARGVAYGMHTMRVDGNDVFAVAAVMRRARELASGCDGTGVTKPVLVEAMTYREGHHSTSDDSTRYRSTDEILGWRERSNPVRRLRKYLERKGWWDSDREEALVASERRAVLQAMAAAEGKAKPDVRDLVTDVYAEVPPHLEAQYAELRQHMAKHPEQYAAAAH